MIWSLAKERTNLGHELFFRVKSGSCCDFARVIIMDARFLAHPMVPYLNWSERMWDSYQRCHEYAREKFE